MKKLLVLLMLVPFVANAGIYIEPYLGYGFGEGTVKDSSDGSSQDYDLEGDSVMGGRLGYSFLGIMGGYEYSQTSNKAKYSDGTKNSTDTSLHGLFVGYTFPSLIPLLGKVWGTYNFGGEYKEDGQKNDHDGGYALGLGLAPIPIPLPLISLHLNFEYRSNDFKKGTEKYTNDTYVVSVSVPIDI